MRPSPLALARGALLGVALSVALNLAADPDLWGHLKYGLDVLDTGRLAPADTYSFASDRPWVNHEWLFEVLLGLAYRAAGPVGLQLLAAGLALAGLVAARAAARLGGLRGLRLDIVPALVFLFGIAPLAQTIRPQAASALLFIVLLTLVRAHDAGRTQVAWWLPPLFLLWANVHGAWVLAGGVLAIWASGRLMESPKAPARWALYATCAVAAMATLVNPHGTGLWQFLMETVRFERADISEWHSVSTEAGMLGVWVATTLVLAVGAWRVQRSERVYLAVCAFLALASFQVMRILPFYTMSVALLVVPRLVAGRPAASPGDTVESPVAARDWLGATVMCAACVVASTTSSVRLGCLEPRGRFVVDPQSVTFLKESGATGRLLVDFNWGEYAAWHLAPAMRVSMDGRRETVYSATAIAAHRDLVTNGPSARAHLEQLSPDWIWLPRSAPVAAALDDWGWRRVFESPLSAVWTRSSTRTRTWRGNGQPNACFPSI